MYSLLSDYEIAELAQAGMIDPFIPTQMRELSGKKVISYGLSSFGYDIRIADEFKIFTPNPHNTIVDPKNVDTRCYMDYIDAECVIPPNSYILCRSYERFKIPDDILVLVVGKSTYARCGIIVNVTPGEPGWEGYWTIEISNASPLPAKIYANEGIAQCLFFRAKKPMVNYRSREGKYQGQKATITLAKL